VGLRGGLVALHSLSTIKKGTNPFNFQSNEPFLSFYDNTFYKNLICPRVQLKTLGLMGLGGLSSSKS
jgi:hypothetical protein